MVSPLFQDPVYDGLQITNNTIQVLNAQSADPESDLGIWENGHAHTSNITVSGNQFINLAMANNPAANLQRGFRVTSHSSVATVVTYQNNTVEGAYIGFQWLAGQNFSGNQVYTGVAHVTRRGSVATFQQNPSGRRVLATYDGGVFKGTASLQAPPGTTKCTITDKDTRNNTCACP